MKKDAVEEGIKDIQFIDGLKNGFVNTVLMQNKFEAKEFDGTMIFVNSMNKTIQDCCHEFALTPEGKAYIKNPSSGSSARSSNTYSNQSMSNSLTRAEYNELVKDPAKFAEFRSTHKSWSIVD